jgi:hypothetical protein
MHNLALVSDARSQWHDPTTVKEIFEELRRLHPRASESRLTALFEQRLEDDGEGRDTMKIFYIALVLAIAVAAVLVPFSLSAHERVGACSLNVIRRCQIKSMIMAEADCRDICTQHLVECRAARGSNDHGCQAEYAVCISSCR